MPALRPWWRASAGASMSSMMARHHMPRRAAASGPHGGRLVARPSRGGVACHGRQSRGRMGTIGQTVIPNGGRSRPLPPRRSLAARVGIWPAARGLLSGCIGRLEQGEGAGCAGPHPRAARYALPSSCWRERAASGKPWRRCAALGHDSDRVTFLGQVNRPERLYPAF